MFGPFCAFCFILVLVCCVSVLFNESLLLFFGAFWNESLGLKLRARFRCCKLRVPGHHRCSTGRMGGQARRTSREDKPGGQAATDPARPIHVFYYSPEDKPGGQVGRTCWHGSSQANSRVLLEE